VAQQEAAWLDQLIQATDQAIDEIVFDLYGLDAAERAIVQEQTRP